MKKKLRSLRIAVVICSLGLLSSAFGQASDWPQSPIKLVVPFTPGTGMDLIARAVAPHLGERLGQAVIVQNMPGASGNIGSAAVAKAKPDGYTLLVSANTMLIAAQAYKNVSFDPRADFAPITVAARGTLMLVANPKSGIASVRELIRKAKRQPGHISFGSPGVGTPQHMAMELLKLKEDIDVLPVPYKGTAGFTQDLLSGEVMVGVLSSNVAKPFIETGKLVPLGVFSAERLPSAPGVPTLNELLQKDMEVDTWYAFFAPAGTPSSVVKRLNTEMSSIMNSQENKKLLELAGLESRTSTPEELKTLVSKDYARWTAVIKRSGVSLE